MRTIKFKGQTVDTKQWLFGDLIQLEKDFTKVFEILDWSKVSDKKTKSKENLQVIPETVGEFTGLTDKNGVEIYENDIIRKHNYRNREYIEDYIVVFDYGGFCLKTIKDNEIHDKGTLISFGNFEENGNLRKELVVGNVYESPELL